MNFEEIRDYCNAKEHVTEGVNLNSDIINNILNAELSEEIFENLSKQCFKYQYANNPIYQDYINYLSFDVECIRTSDDIPFLPIEFFKTHRVFSGSEQEELKFFSSGTTGMQASTHFIKDSSLYIQSFIRAFNIFYGHPEDYCILALLPSYLERGNSSLVYMVDKLIQMSGHPESGFYLYELEDLYHKIELAESKGLRTILFGVSYALLDFADRFPMELQNTIIIETGGMKGRREEILKEELHAILTSAFKLESIHSEYGMTELLSQAYSFGKGIFHTPPWMKIKVRDPYDPFSYLDKGRTGGINIIDLANWHSCSFIETQDLGHLSKDRGFEILGRYDNSDIRGCNLLVQ